MNTIANFKSINSICTTSAELIKSKEFIKWLSIILKKAKDFDKKYIISLIIKLQYWEPLNCKEKDNLNSFLNNTVVNKLWQELLWNLKNISVKIKANNNSELLDSICAKDWFIKIKSYIQEIINQTEQILNITEWFTKISININWEPKEIYLENENLRIDSRNWKEKEIWGIKVKINEEWDITEYLEWKMVWEQLFTWESAIREIKKQWKKLPNSLMEFQAIITKVWVEKFNKKSIGYRYEDESGFWNIDSTYFWLESAGLELAEAINFDEIISEADLTWFNKNSGLSVRCIKY